MSTAEENTPAGVADAFVPPPLPVSSGIGAGVVQPWATVQQTFPFKVKQLKLKGKSTVTDFRSGELTLSPEGVRIAGKSLLPLSTRTMIFVVLFIALRFIGALIHSLLFEYIIQLRRDYAYSWAQIERIGCEPAKQRVCIVYWHPTGKNKPRTGEPIAIPTALAFSLPGGLYEEFVQAAQRFAPEKVSEEKLVPPMPWWGVILLVLGMILVLALFGIYFRR